MKLTKLPLKNTKAKAQDRKKPRNTALKDLQNEYEKEIQKKFELFKSNQKYEFIKSRLMEFVGKNYPIDYKSHYDFKEQW